MRRVVAALIGAALALGGPVAAASAAPAPCTWPMYGHDPGHSFAQSRRCSSITRLGAPRMVPAWYVPTKDSVTASPAVVGGIVYVGSWDGVMHAIDQKTGKVRWEFSIPDTNTTAFGRIESSAAVVDVGRTRVVLFGGGATLYALDGRTGRPLTSVCLDPRADPVVRCKGDSNGAIEVESSPAVVKVGNELRVVVGLDVHNSSNVGRTGVSAFRLRAAPWALEPLWKFDPENKQTYTGAGLLTRNAGTGNGCASVWSSPVVDATDTGMVFFGTGSCSHDGITSGESLWGVRLADGAYVWQFDAHSPARYPSRRWDDDFGASPNLLPFGMVGDGSKDGHYYALDRRSGALKWDTHAAEAGHVTVDFAVGGMIGSAAVGQVRGRPAVFATSAISTPINAPLDEKPGDIDTSLAGDPGRMLSIHAMDARTGKILWRSPIVRQSYGAATYANGVVFAPSTFSSTVDVLDANTGLPLSIQPVIGPPSSAPVTLGSMMFVGGGTRTTDLEYKAFGAGALDFLGPSPLTPVSGVWGYRVLLPPG